MLTTKAEQAIYVQELRQLVNKVERRPPPPKPIEADGFEMQHPAAAIRERLRKDARRQRIIERTIDVAVYFGAFAAALTLSTTVAIVLIKL